MVVWKIVVVVLLVLAVLTGSHAQQGDESSSASTATPVEKKRRLRMSKKQLQALRCDMCLRVVDFVIKGIAETKDNYKYRKARARIDKDYVYGEYRRSEQNIHNIMADAAEYITEGFLLHPMNYSKLSKTRSAYLHLDSGTSNSQIETAEWERISRRQIISLWDNVIEEHENEINSMFHLGSDDDEYHTRLCADTMGVCAGGWEGVFKRRKELLMNDKDDKEVFDALPEDVLEKLNGDESNKVLKTKRKGESGRLVTDDAIRRKEIEARHRAAEEGVEYVPVEPDLDLAPGFWEEEEDSKEKDSLSDLYETDDEYDEL